MEEKKQLVQKAKKEHYELFEKMQNLPPELFRNLSNFAWRHENNLIKRRPHKKNKLL